MIIPSECGLPGGFKHDNRGLAGETRWGLNIIPSECGLPGGFKHDNPVRMSYIRQDLYGRLDRLVKFLHHMRRPGPGV